MKIRTKKGTKKTGSFLEIESDKKDTFLYIDSKSLKQVKNSVFCPFSYSKSGDSYFLSYQLGTVCSVNALMRKKFPENLFQEILLSLYTMVKECDLNALARQKIFFKPEHVYYNKLMSSLRFIYYPFQSYNDTDSDLSFLANICENAQVTAQDYPYVTSTYDYALSNSVLTSTSFEHFLISLGLLSKTNDSNLVNTSTQYSASGNNDERLTHGFNFVDAASQDLSSGCGSHSSGSLHGNQQDFQGTGHTITSDDGEVFALGTTDAIIGRSASCELRFPDAVGLSREHAVISYYEGQYYIKDLNSTNGTFLNGNKLLPNEFYVLEPYSVIRLAKTNLRFD